MFIENCSISDIANGNHHYEDNTILIQITDPGGWISETKYSFIEKYHFDFFDIEDDDHADDPEMYFQEWQGKEIIDILKNAYDNKHNVVVQCVAGMCRSGAVVEIGSHLGFNPVEKFRSPNTRMMRIMMEYLNLPYTVEYHDWREDYRKYYQNN